MTRSPRCFQCVHYSDKERFVCKAFPNGIPSKILGGIHYHFVKHEEQVNDFVFESEDAQTELFNALSYKALKDQEWTINAIKEDSISILRRMNDSEDVPFDKFEVYLSAYDSRMIVNVDLIHCHKVGGHSELVSIGFHSNLFKNLGELLFIARLKDYQTDLHYTASVSGEMTYKFFDFTNKESSDYQYDFRLAKHRLENNRLIKAGYKLLEGKELKLRVEALIKSNKSTLPLHPNRILRKLRKEKMVADICLIEKILKLKKSSF